MSTHSAKTAGVSKTARRSVKKGAKTAAKSDRKTITKVSTASKSARNPVGKATRLARAQPAAATKVAVTMIRTASRRSSRWRRRRPIQRHKYQVGQVVYYTSPTFGRASATATTRWSSCCRRKAMIISTD